MKRSDEDPGLLDHLTAEDQKAVEETGSITEWILGESLEPVAPRERAAHIDGVAIGVLVGLDARGPLVDFPDSPEGAPIVARATLALAEGDVGREVALLFEGGNPARPMVIGLMHAAGPPRLSAREPMPERLVFTADKEIVFRCGKASITLTRAGKILLRGAYLLSEASGANRIRGGTVEIN